MDWSYGFASKGSNNKVKDEYDDCDEKGKPTDDGYGYPYEDGVMSKPAAVVVDGGQRKSSITHYPNVDGSDSYVVRTERVVKVVRPMMTTHYSLKENHDNLGVVNSFLDQFLKEAGMSATPALSRSNCRPAWADRDDSPLKYAEHCQFSAPNMGIVPKYSSWEDTEHHELSRPSTGTRRNWQSQDESPPRSVTHPQWNHPNHSDGRHNWPSRDDSPPNSSATPNWTRRYDSPPRSMAHPELNHLNSSARPNWPSRDDSTPRSMVHRQVSHPNFGSTPNWPRQYDSPPRPMEYPELSHPNSSVRLNWPSRYNSPPRSTRHLASSHPNSSARSNWPTRDESPPSRFMTRPELSYPNSSTRPNWPSRYDDSPPKSVYLGSSHPNSGVRPNWSSSYRDDSPPKPMEYPLLSNHNSSAKPNWPSRVESPPRSMTYPALSHPNTDTKPNWSSGDDSPLRSTEDFELNQPNSSIKPNWQNGDHSLPKSTTHPELSRSNSNTKSNWQSRDDSPPKSTKFNELSHSNSSVKPNWPSQNSSSPKSIIYPGSNGPNSSSTKPSWPSHEDSPDNIENGRDKINTGLVLKKFDEMNLQDSRGTSPLPNERPNWPNRKGHADNGTNRGISPYKSNKDDHEKPKSNGAQSKNTNDEEIPDINNHKIATQRDLPKNVEDSYKVPNTDWPVQDDDDDFKMSGILGSSTNVSNKAGKTKPNYSSGWYKQPNPPPVSSTTNEVSDIMKLVEEAKKTAIYDPNEITPNPPQQVHYSMYAVPAAPWSYYKPVLDSNQALMKYNGIIIPNTYQGK